MKTKMTLMQRKLTHIYRDTYLFKNTIASEMFVFINTNLHSSNLIQYSQFSMQH